MLNALDLGLFETLNQTWTLSFLDSFFPLITDLHKTMVFKIFAPIFVLFLCWKNFSKKWWIGFLGVLIILGSSDFLSNQLLKKSFQRPRPADNQSIYSEIRCPYSQGSFSFPSNHAVNMFTFASLTLILFGKPIGVFFGIMAILVAYSRIYCGVHYPSDVLAGSIIGILWGTFWSSRLLKKLRLENSKS